MEDNELGNFSVRYYGPALDTDHSLSVKSLAPALLSLSDAVEEAKNTLEPNAKIELRVMATVPGSFDIQLLLQGIADFSNTANGQGLEYLATVGGIGFIAVFAGAVTFIKKKLQHGKAKEIASKPIESDSDSTTFSDEEVTMEFSDGTTAKFHRSMLKIAKSDKFVNNLGKSLAGPTKLEGIDGAELSTDNEKIDVSVDEAVSMSDWSSEDEEEEETIENDSRILIQPVDPHLETGKKWNVTTGSGTKYQVDVEDEDFLERVRRGERLGRFDTFEVTLHTTSIVKKDGRLSAQYKITKVHSHRPYEPEVQGNLFE